MRCPIIATEILPFHIRSQNSFSYQILSKGLLTLESTRSLFSPNDYYLSLTKDGYYKLKTGESNSYVTRPFYYKPPFLLAKANQVVWIKINSSIESIETIVESSLHNLNNLKRVSLTIIDSFHEIIELDLALAKSYGNKNK